MELVTGRAGSPHITSQQDRQKHQGIWGDGAYILATGNQLEPQVQSSNKILIKDGALMFQGALFSVKVGTTDEITINNGNQGMQRKDLVVARYTYDSSQQIESAEWVVIQGEPAESNPVAPSGTNGDIQEGDATVDCPFMIVNLDGINVTGVDIIPEVATDIPTINASLSNIRFEVIESETKRYYVKKYENGWFEAWMKTTVNPGDFTFIAFGGTSVLYRARFTNFGMGIKATEVYDIEVSAANSGIIWCASCGMNANMSAIDGYVVQHGSDNARTTTMRAHVTGKWK